MLAGAGGATVGLVRITIDLDEGRTERPRGELRWQGQRHRFEGRLELLRLLERVFERAGEAPANGPGDAPGATAPGRR